MNLSRILNSLSNAYLQSHVSAGDVADGDGDEDQVDGQLRKSGQNHDSKCPHDHAHDRRNHKHLL